MKTMTLNVILTDPEYFLTSEPGSGLALYLTDPKVTTWKNIGTVEIDVSGLDIGELTREAVESIDERIKDAEAQFEQAMSTLKNRKAKLLAIPHVAEG